MPCGPSADDPRTSEATIPCATWRDVAGVATARELLERAITMRSSHLACALLITFVAGCNADDDDSHEAGGSAGSTATPRPTAGRGGSGAGGASAGSSGRAGSGGKAGSAGSQQAVAGSGGDAGSAGSAGMGAKVDCPDGVATADYVIIRTKAELDAFAKCRVAKKVEVRGMVDYRIDADIVLPNLESAESFSVNVTDAKLVSAPKLVTASISIDDNPLLEAVKLPRLEAGKSVGIGTNPKLHTLELPALRTVGGFSLKGNPALEVLSLPALEEITDQAWRDIQIGKVETLATQAELQAAPPLALSRIELPSLKAVAGSISIGIAENVQHFEAPLLESLPRLVARNGLPPVFSLPALKMLGSVEIWEDGDLMSVSIPSLTEAREIRMWGNAALSSIEMPALARIPDGFAISHNPMMSTCALNALAEQAMDADPYFYKNLPDCLDP